MQLDLKDTTRTGLLDYLGAQLANFFPDGRSGMRQLLDGDLDEALDRLGRCINAAALWRENQFHYLHSEQNAVFLYYLANTIWRNREDENLCTKLFYLNKALNGFSCFYDNELPERFFIGHSVGIVLVRARYPEYFAIYQNCTVGRHGDKLPVMEDGLIMYPNSAIVGACHVRARTYVAQGASVINADTPGNAVAFSAGGELKFRTPKHDLLAELFRL